jgi:hypothetical protein
MVSLVWHQAYAPGGRWVAKLGEIEVGAVFPNPDGSARWRYWLNTFSEERSAKSTEHAMATVQFAVDDWLRRAGLQVVTE